MVYVHIPFCRSFCKYCGFYSELACPNEDFIREICDEARRRSAEIAATSATDTLYFGGGTPSVLPLSYIGRIADACGGRSYREWTVEVNPDDVTPEYARGLRGLGVNRVSMGVQSLNDGMLRLMNRRHDSAGARKAFRVLREAGFDNISVDVIFGVGGMDEAMLEATVREILDWHPEHVSAYQLSIEEGSALEELMRAGRYRELPDEDCARQYYLICNILRTAGYGHYEISNWALPGRRALHNSAYWTRAPYVGLGPGAHSLAHSPQGATIPLHPQGTGGGPPEVPAAKRPDLTTIPLHPQGTGGVPPETPCVAALRNSPEVRSWNSEELRGWSSKCETLTEEQIREELIMLGLRTADGIPAELLSRCSPESSDLTCLLAPSSVPGRIRIPEDRWFVADGIIASLI